MRALLTSLLISALGCGSAAAPPAEEEPMPLTLTWTAERSPDERALAVTWTVENGSSEPVFLLDQLVVFGAKRDFALAADQAAVDLAPDGALRLSLGYRPSRRQVMVTLRPALRRLDPGEEASGRLTVPLPAAGWHPQDGAVELSGAPSAVTIEIGAILGDVVGQTWPLEAGGEVVVAPMERLPDQIWLSGGSRPLPP